MLRDLRVEENAIQCLTELGRVSTAEKDRIIEKISGGKSFQIRKTSAYIWSCCSKTFENLQHQRVQGNCFYMFATHLFIFVTTAIYMELLNYVM